MGSSIRSCEFLSFSLPSRLGPRLQLICVRGSADIEQEVNGVYSIDRKEKLDSKQMKAMFDEARRVYNSKH